MSKKSLLSCTATATIILFNIHFCAYAETIEVSGGEKTVPTGTYELIHANKGGKITGIDLKIVGNKDINSSTNKNVYAVTAEGTNSAIELNGTTTIKGIDSVISLGAEAKDGAKLQITGGTITVSDTGVLFSDNNKESKLTNVTISSGKDDAPLQFGIKADKNGVVTLENVNVSHADTGIYANDHSTITVSGGSFDGKINGIYAKQDSSIILKDNTHIISYDNVGLHADGSGANITMAGGTVTIKNKYSALLAEKGGQIDATNVSLTTEGKGTGAFALANSTIKLHGNTTISNTLNGLGAAGGGKIISENLTVIGRKTSDPDPEKEPCGVWTEGTGSEIKLTGKTIIQNVDEGFYADGGSKIISGDLTIIGGESANITTGVAAYELDSKIELNGETIIQNVDIGLATANSTLKMSNGISTPQNAKKNKIEAKQVALIAEIGGHIDLKDVSATAGVAGLQLATFLKTNPDKSEQLETYRDNEINLINTDIHVDNGAGILVGALVEKSIEGSFSPSIGKVNLKNSEIHADVLLGDGIVWNKFSWKNKKLLDGTELKEISNGTFILSADHSILEGRANIAQQRNVFFDLKNDTKWILTTSTKEIDDNGKHLDITQRSRSDISVLNLNNSSLVFKEPTEDHYHTLHIGSGRPDTKAVYNATGNAQISFNTLWSDGAPIADQKTDQLLINGDVSGKTNVLVKGYLKGNDNQENTSTAANIRGLSLIQVSGKAEEDSFKLVNGYTTINGSPNKYILRAYGPNSNQGKAEANQSLVENSDNFWDFRLQPEFLNSNPGGSGSNPSGSGSNPGSSSFNPDPEQNVQTVVPQMANYLLMPNALFYTGLIDMAKQNALLANMRTSVLGKQQEKQNGFFLNTYGGTGTLSSESAPLKYGYSGAHLRYATLQGEINFAALEGQDTTIHFGFVGTYGQLSFTPKNMKDASKSTVDKWSLTAYGSIQHDNGVYLDALVSYGILKGDISNAIIGKTAKLKNAKMLNISTTVGKQFATGIASVTFEPQAQIAYQHLMFDTISDADNLTIDMNNPHQWLIRVGGRLNKTVVTAENGRAVSFYGKVNVIKTFGDDQAIYIDKAYQLDPMGSLLEGGLGISAQLSQNVSLHGDVTYQQKLQKTGISGASFSGGIRYQF
ncbi:autotransporter outer membrane beta-barrel domain-containing protein [Bartonella phoceensis]|uniref:autotransporter outer membrane beta-barrel domain-containing protein n=1 Tax=Bartonella phoceensis TaxID=270249 RepID=UPI001ABBA8BD|nr:autotransporter outer membrane beta-barrel domain-containing protein [Bartonella phoceensis]